MDRKAILLKAVAHDVETSVESIMKIAIEFERKSKEFEELKAKVKEQSKEIQRLEKEVLKKEKRSTVLKNENDYLRKENTSLKRYKLSNSQENRELLGSIFHWLRENSGLTQESCGQLLYEHKRNVGRIENGVTSVKKTVEAIQHLKQAHEKGLINFK